MRYKLFGRSGLRVSELCFGTMTFGKEWGWGADKAASREMFDAYLDAGGNFFDTANRYTEGTSEKYLGEFMAGMRERIVLATKYSLYMREKDPNSAGNHRKNMMQSLEASLKRLKTDYIDLYWLHAWDSMTPVDEIMRAFDDMVRAGKVLYIGISDTPAWIVSRANTMAELRGWTRFVGLQVEYSLLERSIERDLLPMARAFDMAVTPWGAIGGGVLTGKYSRTKKVTSSTRRYEEGSPSVRLSERCLAIADEVVAVAEEMGIPPVHVALNWTRQQPGLIIPIVGARTAEQLRQNMACLEHPLSEEHLKRLHDASAIELGFPHDFLTKDYFRDLVYAQSYDRIDDHRRGRL